MEKIPTPSERFKDNLLNFINFFEEMFKEAKEEEIISEKISLFPLVRVSVKKIDDRDIVKWFIEKTYKYWDKIYKKNNDYVEEISSKLFQMVQDGKLDEMKGNDDFRGADFIINKLSKGHIDNFKEVLTGKYNCDDEEIEIFDEDRKEEFWIYLKSFVKISINHIHITREMGEDGKYKTKFFPEINVKEEVERWGIKLR